MDEDVSAHDVVGTSDPVLVKDMLSDKPVQFKLLHNKTLAGTLSVEHKWIPIPKPKVEEKKPEPPKVVPPAPKPVEKPQPPPQKVEPPKVEAPKAEPPKVEPPKPVVEEKKIEPVKVQAPPQPVQPVTIAKPEPAFVPPP
jgi:hypothetical protein